MRAGERNGVSDIVQEKRVAARRAIEEVRDGMIVGLGTGSTVAFAIDTLAERCRAGLTITAVATSLQTETRARQSGIDVVDFASLDRVDLVIDGVDEVDGYFRAIKGAGGAMLREKIVAAAAGRMIAIADSTKAVEKLGKAPVPVEVLPFALGFVQAELAALGAKPTLRITSASEPYQTDQANPILDCAFGSIDDPAKLAVELSGIPGILGHGLFVSEIDALFIARGSTVEMLERAPA